MDIVENTSMPEDNQSSVHAPEEENSEAAPEPTEIAGFWRRIAALLLDSILIGAIGSGLGYLFFDELAAMGEWGRLIGLALFLAYFGYLNSARGGGQTLGKRAVKIKVVDQSGKLVSIQTSLIRAFILGIPGLLNQITMPISTLKSPFGIILMFFIGLIIFGGSIGILYFYLFNRNTRQSLHDLICGTYVVSAAGTGPVETEPVWRGHYIAFAILLALLLAGTIAANIFLHNEYTKEYLNIADRISTAQGAYVSEVSKGVFYGPEGHMTTCTIAVKIKDKNQMNQEFATKVASLAMQVNPGIAKVDLLTVNIRYGYNIGIASGFKGFNGRFPPGEWQEMINE